MFGVIILLIVAFIVVVLVSVYVLSNLVGLIRARGVPFVPLSKKQLESLNRCVRLNPKDKVVDLGCGDGRVLRIFEKQGVKDLTGYEVNFLAYVLAKIKNKLVHSQSKIYFKNFRRINLSQYNVIFCYLLDYYLNSLKKKFDRELKPGTKIISHSFQIKNWRVPEKLGKIFIYRI